MSDTEKQWWQTERNDEVATSPELWRPLARAVGGFDVDPAAGCEPTPIADERYTPDDDGLTSPWYGTVWLNPPFSEKGRWFKRLVAQYEHGDVDRAVAITNAGTDTDWFQDWFTTADVVCFVNGRNCYLQDGSENFASMIGAWNPTPELRDTLATLGTVMEPIETDTQTTLTDL